MAKQEIEVLEPQHGFWECAVVISQEDEESGKVKKVKEVHLIDAVSVTDCEIKCAQEMEGTMYEWKIESIKQSKIQYVY